ncbi:MAG: helix-turn-helix domain-containing protein [Xanthomonadales bacterium]|nr:helix-turn-helix domain-containing protein [Xanthomonadales bacterium]MBK7144943.1 helix-turn-helix domain-containing protein [Xanthomonadales bacterium]MCC6562211.1 helix-turn-helix domain-containing protein [Xanthomonadales bacterium]
MDYPIRSPHQLRVLLKGFIATSGTSQRAMAQKLGVTPQAISKALQAPENMSIQSLMRILALLDVELALRKPEPRKQPMASEW